MEKMEEKIKKQTRLDVELPSFVDDMCMDIIDWEGGTNMQQSRGEGEVAEECKLPLETGSCI